MRRDDVRAMIQDPAIGRRGFLHILSDLLEGRDASGKEVRKVRPEELSFRGLWEAMVGPPEQTLPSYMPIGRNNYIEIQEAVDSTMFPSAVGILIAQKVIDGYEMPGAIGDQLVTVMPSKLRTERIVGFTSQEGPREVAEQMPYEDSSFTEKYVTTEAAKKGRILQVSEEAILFDQTGQILMRASRLGEMTREERELTILAGIVDVGAGAVGYKDVYRPSGVAATLYSTGNNNYLSTATPLVDWTDIDEVMVYHAENVKDDRAIAAEQLPVIWMPKTLLVARKKAGTAARILSATEHRSGTGDVMISGNPVTTIIPGLNTLSSPMLDYLAGVSGSRYDDSDDWLIGDFKKQFVWHEIWPIQTLRARQDDEAAFRRDIVARFKVRYFGGIGCLDTRHVVKVNAV